MELPCVLNNLRAAFFNDQLPLLPSSLSAPLCAGLIHILHCVCTALDALLCDTLLFVGEVTLCYVALLKSV